MSYLDFTTCYVICFTSSTTVSAQKSYTAKQTTAPRTAGKLAAGGAIRTMEFRILVNDLRHPSMDLEKKHKHNLERIGGNFQS